MWKYASFRSNRCDQVVLSHKTQQRRMCEHPEVESAVIFVHRPERTHVILPGRGSRCRHIEFSHIFMGFTVFIRCNFGFRPGCGSRTLFNVELCKVDMWGRESGRRLSCLSILLWRNRGRTGDGGVGSPCVHAGTGPQWSRETGNTQRCQEEGFQAILFLLLAWKAAGRRRRVGPRGPADGSGWGGCRLCTLWDLGLRSWSDHRQGGFTSRRLWRSRFPWETKPECFVLLCSCKSRAEDSFGNDWHVQDVISLFLSL